MPRTKHSSAQTIKILTTLMSEDDTYGWQLSKELGLKETTVYGILKRLKRDNLVVSYYDVEGVDKPKRITLPMNVTVDKQENEEPSNLKGAVRQRHQLTPEGIRFTNELRKSFGKRIKT